MAGSSEPHDRSSDRQSKSRLWGHIEALENVKRKLEEWDDSNLSSGDEDPVEAVREGDLLHSAVVKLESYYKHKRLPKRALLHWHVLLRRSRKTNITDEDSETARLQSYELVKWVNGEILRLKNRACPVAVVTVGDLLKASIEGKTSAYLMNPNILEQVLAHLDVQGGESPDALRMLIGSVAVEMKVDRRQIHDMPLITFLAAVTKMHEVNQAKHNLHGGTGRSADGKKFRPKLKKRGPKRRYDEEFDQWVHSLWKKSGCSTIFDFVERCNSTSTDSVDSHHLNTEFLKLGIAFQKKFEQEMTRGDVEKTINRIRQKPRRNKSAR